MIDKVTIGKIIKKLRCEKNITQEKLAEQIDISTHYLSKVERGLSKLNVEAFLKMAEVLSCSFEDFGINIKSSDNELKNKIMEKILSASDDTLKRYLKAMDFVDSIK